MDKSVDLSYLSPDEYRKIIDVIKRDQDLKKQEDQRIFQLKAEIQRLRKRGIIKQGSLDPTRSCARCLTELGRILNRGAVCSICRKKVCKTCRHFSEDGQQWVCQVCHKQIQLKAITGEWMREYTRTASGRIKKGSSPSKSSASDAISKSIKNTFRTSFLAQQQHSSSSSQSIEEDHEKPENNETAATSVPIPSSFSVVKTIAKGFIPSRLPPIDSLPPKSPPLKSPPVISPPLRSPKSPKSPLSGSEHKSSTEKEDSPKLPPSPVLKVLQSAVDLVSTPGSGQSSRNDSPQHSGEKQTVFRKISNRMLDSSSSEDEDEVSECGGKEELHKTNSSGSTPSPRTPNSCRILSSIAQNQATAFKFPPSSPINSRPSSYERQSERQSSDEFSTTMSSFRSHSTSSELCDENVCEPRLTPQPLPRSRRVSPLRKQRAIAEEVQESQRSSLEAEYGSCPSSATTSAPDSGVADCNYASPPKNFFNSSAMRRSSSGHDDEFSSDAVPARESVSSLSEGEAVVEKTTGYVFRKVTIKKRNSNSQAMQQQFQQQQHSNVDNMTTCVDNANASNHCYERPTTASRGQACFGAQCEQLPTCITHISEQVKQDQQINANKYDGSRYDYTSNEVVTARHYNFETALVGLGLRSRSYYYLYGSVNRCDGCDGCDKDMACERVNTFTSTHVTTNRNQETQLSLICCYCEKLLSEAFISANVEINRLRSMNVDYNDIDFSLINVQQVLKSAQNKDYLDLELTDFKEEENFDYLSESEPDINKCDNNIEERSVSNLEKYYTCSLEEEITQRRIIPPYTHFASMSPFSDNEEWVEDNNQLLETSVDINRCNQIELELEAGHLSDASTSSEEGMFSTPNTSYAPRPQPYGNPLAYSLHTIAEESCEDSERDSSKPSSPTGDIDQTGNESDKFFINAITHNNQYKRNSWNNSEAESIDSLSETSEPAMSADFNDNDIYLASSRLEKYFTSGLLGSGAFNYPEDVEFADESDCDSSKPSLEMTENTTFETQNTFDEENYDTLKRNNNYKKDDDINQNIKVDKEVTYVKFNDEFNESHESKQIESINPESNDLKLNESQTKQVLEINESQALNSCKSSVEDKNKVAIDEDVTTFMKKLLSRMSNFNRIVPEAVLRDEEESANNESVTETSNENPLPSLKVLESQIARLMEAVSPATLSASDNSSTYTSSSTIGSNNSDYGSDTLESDDEEGKDNNCADKRRDKSLNRRDRSEINSGGSSDSTVSEETVYICKQLMSSLKKLTEIAFNDNCNAIKDKEKECATVSAPSDVAKARMYIRDQIVALMHTVKSSSRNTSPLRERKLSQTPFNHQTIDCDNLGGDSSDCGDSSPKIGGISKKKTPSESGSETTCSASVSIPSYDDSDHTPTESEISHEMEELFALLDCSKNDNYSGNLNESNLIGIAARPSSDDDRASLKSWEARISLFAKVQAAEEVADSYTDKSSENNEIASMQRTLTPNKAQEITINGKEIKHKSSEESTNESNNNIVNNMNNTNNSALMPIGLMPIGHKTVVKIDDMNRTDSLSPLFDSLKDRSFSSDSVSSVQTVKARFSTIATASTSEISSDGTQSTSRLAIDEDDEAEVDTNLTTNALRKSFNAKEKASSEDNLLVANLMPAPTKANVTTKSAGNISELDASCNKSTFRDTGYYSFKSSEESIKSLDESVSGTVTANTSRAYSASTLPHYKQPKSETIEEVDEESDLAKMPTKRLFTPSSHHSAKGHSFSSPNIPDDVFSGSRSGSLPLNTRNKVIIQPSIPHRARSSFFSTSGVLRKLTALRGDDNSFRASPRRLRDRNRTTSGGHESDNTHSKQSGGGVPQISVSDYSESFSNRGSVASSAGESTERHDEDIEHVFAYHSRSQTSLSSFGARSESMSSVYSAAGGGRYGYVVVTGEILFCISYNYKAGAMEVYIRECRNLAPVDSKRHRSDPYVKVYLLPDRTKSGKRKTKVKKHTLNPVFEEVLKFYMTISEVETRTLWLSVWHSDIFGRNDFLGEVTLPLGHEVFETPGLKWYPLQERLEVSDNSFSYKGDIFLALKYMPPDITGRRSKKAITSTKGELHVLIKEAHNLTATRSNGTSDPFCKSYLLPDKTKSGKQKTPVIKKTCNPKWNHTFVFDDLTINDLRDRCLELTIWDYDKITSNDFLGGVRLSLGIGKYDGRVVDWMDSIGDEIVLWQQMIDRPNMWVYGELHLRSSMQTRRS